MKEVKNPWNGNIETELELTDIEVGKQYRGNKHISPAYLQNATLTVKKKGRKNVTCTHEAYKGETFSIEPRMLYVIE